jgi:hypothetical protein
MDDDALADADGLDTPTLSSPEPTVGAHAPRATAITTARPILPALAAAVTAATPRCVGVRTPR